MKQKIYAGSVKTPKSLDNLSLLMKEILLSGKSFHYSIEVHYEGTSLTIDDYLQAAIKQGALQRVGDAYRWKDTIPRGVIALWVDKVALETGIQCQWRWAERMFARRGLCKRLQEARGKTEYQVILRNV